MNRKRAIIQGIDSARVYRKDGPFQYPRLHPLFHYWWEAVVLKSDSPELSDRQIIQDVTMRLEKRYGRATVAGAA